MTLSDEEFKKSKLWRHRKAALILSVVVVLVGGIGSALGPIPFPLGIPIGVAMLVDAFVLLRLALLYYAPKNMKEGAI